MAQLTVMPGAARPRPTKQQHLAADPACSVWVSASAGTGKTRVLSNRLLRLLVDGADPAGVLCLTYTKAGAAEMARRVQDDLARLAAMAEDALVADLEGLIGRAPRAAEMVRAKNGLLQVLDLPAGLRIMTIHSFCQSLLYRFPLEAGISPHFELLEPRAQAGLMREARDAVLLDRSRAMQEAVQKLAVALGEHSLGEGLAALDGKRAELTRLLAEHRGDVDRLVDAVFAALGVEPGMTLDSLRAQAVDDPAMDEPGLAALASALWSGTEKTDIPAARTIGAWLEGDAVRRLDGWPDYQLVFLTRDGKPRAKMPTAGVVKAHPHVLGIFEAEQTRILALAEQAKAVAVAEKTAALLRVGAAVIRAYERRKQAGGGLDYIDLIETSRGLLANPEAGDWVRYKLDQRIDHLLIDESQDTSPDQWAIIEALIEDFWVGEGARPHPPTLFVVGDEKQSIFGFQGANVETYQRLRRIFAGRAKAALRPWEDVPLDQSFRSAPAILQAVDAVFDGAIARGVHSSDQPMRHQAFAGHAKGLVELWPLIEGEAPAGDEPWALPDRPQLVDSAELVLARCIAEQIRQWLRDETRLANLDRPIHAGDIMILLPRRGVLQDLLIRQLKKNHVPVAGADRIGLTEELAVMDLMALGDALLLPDDDLTMATLLRSPLFGLSEEQLFRLAYGRGQRPLWRRLGDLRDEHKDFAAADDRFRDLLAKVDYVPPFEFFARFLAEGAPSGRKRLLQRLGHAAELPIEAFLAQAIAHERANPPSMQGFLHWLRADSEAIKRDPGEGGREVRIMTVHGSKGLEAPIVFLADATYGKTIKQDKLLWRKDGLPLWKGSKQHLDRQSQAIYQEQELRAKEEHRRLLYVAMTRAEERLIVAGCARKKRAKDGDEVAAATWYEMIEAGLKRLPASTPAEVTLPGGVAGEVLRFGDAPADPPTARQGTLDLDQGAAATAPLPDWLQAAVRGEVRVEDVRPSADLEADDPPAASPLSGDQQRRFGRGLLIHRLLQILPDLAQDAREDAMRRYLEKPGHGLDGPSREEIAGEVRAVLDHPDWASLFGPGSRAEVPLVGQVGGKRVNGQVDRLAVLPDQVLIVDYKTNRPPPKRPDQVAPAYGRQMAIYRALLRQIYPDRRVRCALLWTEGPRLMMLEDGWLDGFGAS
ncbi:MAG: double-strand break repair helicase AddA [Alphaproteobacteria bacterium]